MDGATVISKNAERETYLEYSTPIFSKRGFVYYLVDRDNKITWNTFQDLEGLAIGIVSGHNYGAEFESATNKYNLSLHPVISTRQNFDKLIHKRIDVLLSTNLPANYLLNQDEFKGKITHAPKSYFSKDYHIAFSKQSAAKELIPKINAAIIQLKQNGVIQKMLLQYQ